jgi:hypothetical protein
VVGFAAAGGVLVLVGAIGVVLLVLLAWGTYLLVRHRRSRRAEPR